MTESTQNDSELSATARETVIRAITDYEDVGLASYGDPVTVHGSEETTDQNGDPVTEFDVLVDTVGRLSLSEVMQSNGLLLACSEEIEVKLAGFQDTEIALTVKEQRDG